jgi:23S rRNA (cytosine1962-C5)-methyltransferase
MNRDPRRITRPHTGAPRRAYDEDDGPSGPPADALRPWVLLRSANKHPFIFKRMVRAADPQAKPGDIVHVYDKLGALFGRGFYNPRSQIALRMLVHGDKPVDDTFWAQKIEQAIDLRRSLQLDATTDAYRLVHAEGDGLSGLIVERYADCLAFEFFSLGMYQRRTDLIGHLSRALGAPASLDKPGRASPQWRTVLRADEHIEHAEGFHITSPSENGPAPDTVVIREHGVRYKVDLATGHKTGFFCDQRDNRRLFATLCNDANVLDLCCYTGGFGICAKVLGGAKEVISVDLDEAALAIAKENVNLNSARVQLIHSDAFIYLRQMLANGRQFDAVVCDPPKLVRDREELEDGLRKYHDLNALAIKVVRPGGILLTCSCSGLVGRSEFIETVHRAARPGGRELQIFNFTGAGADHPVMLNCPESAYLKAMWLRVL